LGLSNRVLPSKRILFLSFGFHPGSTVRLLHLLLFDMIIFHLILIRCVLRLNVFFVVIQRLASMRFVAIHLRDHNFVQFPPITPASLNDSLLVKFEIAVGDLYLMLKHCMPLVNVLVFPVSRIVALFWRSMLSLAQLQFLGCRLFHPKTTRLERVNLNKILVVL
jgi:hypothetical protein